MKLLNYIFGKKNWLLVVVGVVVGVYLTKGAWGQTTINFDNAANWTAGSGALTSYCSDHTYIDGVFSATGGPALRNGTTAQDGYAGALGTYSWRLQNATTVEWIITISSGGVGDFSIDLRRWDASPSPAFDLDYSTDGGSNWTNVTTIDNAALDNSSNWKTFYGTIDNSANNIKIRLKATGTTERIMVDNFYWEPFSGSTPTITLSTSSLTGFNYTEDAGPSTEQTFTVAGTNLTANISIAASTNYEISKTSGSGYTSPLTFTQSGGSVSETTVYVRLKSGLTTGNYNSETITASSSGATNKTVTCSGSVVDYPNWCNVHPGSGSITTGGEFLVYAQIYEPSLTEAVGQGAGVTCHIGYSSSNTNPNTWTNWVAASYFQDNGNNDEYKVDIGPSLLPAGTYYVASRFSLNGGATYSYGGYSSGGGNFWDGSSYVSCVVTVTANYPDWCNLQYPASGSISVGGSYDVYAQVYESGVTEGAGQGTNVSGWIGYNTANTNPNTWTNWVAATFNSQSGNNDEFKADIGTALPAGTYYYASRFKVNPNADEYKYGGYNSGGGNFWDGSTYVSGVLTVTSLSCADDLIISEYYEGASNDKYIEIYNGTSGSINLSNYKISLYYNGSTSATDISLSGTLTQGNTFIIANSSSNATILGFADATSGSLSFNGNDAVALRTTGGSFIDVIGQVGNDPGTEWGSGTTSTADNTIVRKSEITDGDTNQGDSFDPSTEWNGYSNTTSYAGSHTMTCVAGTSTITAGAGSEPTSISSLIDTQGEAVLNFDFIVTDDGATPATDALNTYISEMVIEQGTGNDISDWTQAIAGALLTDGTATQTANIAINATNITISSIAHSGGTDLGYIPTNVKSNLLIICSL